MSLHCKSPLVRDKPSNKCVSKEESKLRKRRSGMLKKIDKLETKNAKLGDKLNKINKNWPNMVDVEVDKTSPKYRKLYRKYKKSVKNIQQHAYSNSKTHDLLLKKVTLIEHHLGIRSSEPY